MKKRRHVRIVLLALVCLAAAWLLPSLIHAERYRRRLQTNLQQLLGRQVRFGTITLELLPRPGFSIDNLTVLEDRAFGSEAFARVDHVDCNLAAGRLLQGRITLSSLHLRGAAINVVRNASGQWNVEHLGTPAPGASSRGTASGDLGIEVDDARLNFKSGADKTPFAVIGVTGRLSLERGRNAIHFDLTGAPVRTDLGLPTPGSVEFQGDWSPGAAPGTELDATFRTRGALVYDWIPMVTSRNPGIYGLIDADAHITGSLALLNVDAHARISQLRRWDSLPPVNDFPVNLSLRGRIDRAIGEASIDNFSADFGSSHLALTGNLARLGREPLLNLVAKTSNSRLQDMVALGARLTGPLVRLPQPAALTGKLGGVVVVAGAWPHASYSGSITASAAQLEAGHSSLSAPDLTIECGGREINLPATRIVASPHLSLQAEGVWHLGNAPDSMPVGKKRHRLHETLLEPGYRLTISAQSVPAHELTMMARDLGMGIARDADLHGPVSVSVALTSATGGGLRPVVAGSAELHEDTLWLPGLLQPIPIQEARIAFQDDRIAINPLTASFAGSSVTGRLMHSGPRSEPWTFAAQASRLDLPEALSWFEAFGHRAPVSWFERIPGLDTLAGRRAAGSGLFAALHARGEFSTPALRYGPVLLRDFTAHADIAKRDLRVSNAAFRLSTGRGQASANFDLTNSIPRLAADFDIEGLRVENWASQLPPQLAELRGAAALDGHVSSSGTTGAQLQSNLQGRAQVRLANIDLGHFDPVRGAAQMAGWGDLAANRVPLTLRSAILSLAIQSRHVAMEPLRLEFGGAIFELAGGCDFDGTSEFESTVDLRRVNRRWLVEDDDDANRKSRFTLSGDLSALRASGEGAPAQARR